MLNPGPDASKTTGRHESRGPASTISPVTFLVSYRTQLFLRYPWSLWTLKLSCTVLVMGLMVPVSFSMFPQTGRVSVISSPCEKSTRFTIHFCQENIIYIESHPPDHLCSFGFCFSSWYIRSVSLGLENNYPLRYFKCSIIFYANAHPVELSALMEMSCICGVQYGNH